MPSCPSCEKNRDVEETISALEQYARHRGAPVGTEHARQAQFLAKLRAEREEVARG